MRRVACVMFLTAFAALAGCNDTSGSTADTRSLTSLAISTPSAGSAIAVITRPPTISGSPTPTATVGQAYRFQPLAADPNGLALSYSISGKPDWATFNATNGALAGTPGASDVGTSGPILISVSDGTLSAALAAFTIAVAAAPIAAPVAPATGSATVSWTAPTMNTDGTPIENLAGYTIYYGTSATALSLTVAIADPTATSFTLGNLASGTWYFAVSAVNSAGVESAPSPAVSDTVG